MKVIIAGSRTISSGTSIERAVKLSGFEEKITEIVSGTARGADRLGEQWAAARGVPIKKFPANWARDGKVAGFLRNMDMAEYADALIAVWDGVSRGTQHMIDAMLEENKQTYIYKVDLT